MAAARIAILACGIMANPLAVRRELVAEIMKRNGCIAIRSVTPDSRRNSALRGVEGLERKQPDTTPGHDGFPANPKPGLTTSPDTIQSPVDPLRGELLMRAVLAQ